LVSKSKNQTQKTGRKNSKKYWDENETEKNGEENGFNFENAYFWRKKWK